MYQPAELDICLATNHKYDKANQGEEGRSVLDEEKDEREVFHHYYLPSLSTPRKYQGHV